MDALLHDLRYAIRHIGQRPGLPIVIVLSLAFAMGVRTSMFAVMNGTWFTPWSVANADTMRVVAPAVRLDEWNVWREHSRSFSSLAAREGLAIGRFNDELVRLDFVSANYFDVLHVPMFMGRALTEDDTDGVVLAHRLWQVRFGSDSHIIGRTIVLDPVDRSLRRVSLAVVGVAAPGFDGPDTLRTQFWLPTAVSRRFHREDLQLRVLGHLAPAVSDREAEAELTLLSRRLHGNDNAAERARVSVTGTARYAHGPIPLQTEVLWGTLLIGIALITFVACANVSQLLLARGHSRRAEIALRLAMGASRAAILRGLLVESSLLCLGAAALGLAIATWLPTAISQGLIQSSAPELASALTLNFPIDAHVFAFGVAMSAAACIVFGLLPAWRCSQVALSDVLKDAHGISRGAPMPSLLSYQAIVSVMVLAIAGLMLRSASITEARMMTASMADLTAVRLRLPQTADQKQAMVRTMSERLAAVSGGGEVAGLGEDLQIGTNQTLHVTTNYFRVLRIRLLAGRIFTPSDHTANVMVVNESLARRFWPGQIAVGQIVRPDGRQLWDKQLGGREVIGIVGDAPLANPAAYLPADPQDVRVLLVRAPQPRVTREIAPLLTTLPPDATTEVLSGTTWIAPAVGPGLFAANMTMTFGGMALVLGAVGFFSFFEFSVQQRRQEIGVRRALGATSLHVTQAVVTPAAYPIFRGMLLGCVGAALVGLALKNAGLPAGVDPFDVVTYLVGAGVLVVAFILASIGPAFRAARVDPMMALRAE